MDEETAALIDLLRTSRRAPMRLEAVRQLAARHDPAAAGALLETLQQSNDPRVVPVITAAIEGLSHLGPAIAPLLRAIMADSADPRRVFMPLLLAANLGATAIPDLIEALDDEQIEVRINAATQLGQLGDSAAYSPLLVVVTDAGQPSTVRGVAAAALGALRDRRALPILAELAAGSDPDLLAGAIDGLADLRDPAGIPYLEALLERGQLDERTNRAIRLGLLAMERYRDR
jgi:HEAT repeat protein